MYKIILNYQASFQEYVRGSGVIDPFKYIKPLTVMSTGRFLRVKRGR
jgi:hypothetical protein